MAIRETTKERIQRSALKLFVEKGVAETTVRDIASATGLSEGSLYRHFEGKEALARELFYSGFRRLAEELERCRSARNGLREQLRGMILHICELFERDRHLFSYLLLAQHGFLRDLEAGMAHPLNVLRDAVAAAIGKGEIPTADPDVTAGMIAGLVLQVAVDRTYGRVRCDLVTLAETLSAAAWRIASPA